MGTKREIYAGSDKTLFRIEDGKAPLCFDVDAARISNLKLAENLLFASSTKDNMVYVMNPENGEILKRFESAKGIFDVMKADDYFAIATLAKDGSVNIRYYAASCFPHDLQCKPDEISFSCKDMPKKLKFAGDYLIVMNEGLHCAHLMATEKKLERVLESVQGAMGVFRK